MNWISYHTKLEKKIGKGERGGREKERKIYKKRLKGKVKKCVCNHR